MFAIVDIAGQQFKVAKDQKLFVHRLDAKTGDKVSFDQVFMVADGDNITVGAPAVANASVEAKVVRHLKDDKVIVFKKKRRKGYRVKNGHRQSLTEIVIESLGVGKVKKAAPKAKAEAPKAAARKAVKKAVSSSHFFTFCERQISQHLGKSAAQLGWSPPPAPLRILGGGWYSEGRSCGR